MPGIQFNTNIDSGFGGPPPTLRRDPLEQAIKQAQLYNLQQDTGLRQRALTLQAMGLEHNRVNDEAMRKIQEAGLLENTRHNTATERNASGDLAETTRYHSGELANQIRGQDITAKDSSEGHKIALADTLLAHGLVDPALHDAIPGTLAKLGLPELQQGIADMTTKKTQATAANQLNQIVTLHGAGNIDAANMLIENTKKNPDVYNLIKDHLPGSIAPDSANPLAPDPDVVKAQQNAAAQDAQEKQQQLLSKMMTDKINLRKKYGLESRIFDPNSPLAGVPGYLH